MKTIKSSIKQLLDGKVWGNDYQILLESSWDQTLVDFRCHMKTWDIIQSEDFQQVIVEDGVIEAEVEGRESAVNVPIETIRTQDGLSLPLVMFLGDLT